MPIRLSKEEFVKQDILPGQEVHSAERLRIPPRRSLRSSLRGAPPIQEVNHIIDSNRILFPSGRNPRPRRLLIATTSIFETGSIIDAKSKCLVMIVLRRKNCPICHQ